MLKVLKKIIQYPRVTLGYPAEPLNTEYITGRPCIDTKLCTMCGECVRRCPTQAIVEAEQESKLAIKLEKCIFCSLCEDVCPTGAMTMVKEFELTKLADEVVQKSSKIFGRSLQIREVDAGSCNGCDYEINGLNNPFNDIERFGIHFVASPRHADMLLVTGTATRNMEQALLKTYEATPDPKLVVAVGACACSGGIFQDSYATRNGIASVIPVDAYVPGCPPRPQAILYGILKALDRVK